MEILFVLVPCMLPVLITALVCWALYRHHTRFSSVRLKRCAERRANQRLKIDEHLTRAKNNLYVFERLSRAHGASLYMNTVDGLGQWIADTESALACEDYDRALKLAMCARDKSDLYLRDLGTAHATG